MQKIAAIFGLGANSPPIPDNATTYEVIVTPVSTSRKAMKELAATFKGHNLNVHQQRVIMGKRCWIGHMVLTALRMTPAVRVVVLHQVY